MNIFFVTKVSMPNGMAATKRIVCYSKGLAEAGAKVEILVLNRTENIKNVHNNETNGTICNGCTFRYFSKSTIRHGNLIIRKYNDLKDYLHCFLYLLNNSSKDSIIFTYGDFIIIPFILILISKIKGAKICRELCEYPYYTVENVTVLRKIKSWIVLNALFPFFDFVIPISEELKKIAEKHCRKHASILKVPIMVDKQDVLFEECPFNSDFIFHSGKFDEQKDGFVSMIKAFALSHKLNTNLHFISTGKLDNCLHKNEISQIMNEYNITKFVHFVGYLTNKELLAYQKSCLFFIVNKLDTFQNKYCFPTKIGEYLLSGRPVITTSIGEANFYLKDKESAIIIPPGDISKLSDMITYLANNKDACEIIGKKGKEIANINFDYKNQGRKLYNLFMTDVK